MFHRRPLALSQLTDNASVSLARLAAIEGFARALLVGVVPLVVHEALGDKTLVARVYLAAALFTMLVTLNIGTLERWLQRRRVVTLGGAFLIVASLLLHLGNPWLMPLGIGMRSAAASIFSVCLSLYIMDYIGKRELTRNESTRMQYSAIAWLSGPWLGSWLIAHDHPALPFVLSGLSALLMLAYFWRLRLGSDRVIREARSAAGNPWHAIRQYWSQKRLRIAYGITLSRSCYWVAVFVYGPIYVIEAGLPAWVAGVLLSGISGFLLLSPLVRRLADRFGTRQIIAAGLSLTTASLLVLWIIGPARPLGLVFWMSGALGGAMLDVLGNIPFMRSVRQRERLAMTTVFSTWREASELLTPLLVTLVTLALPFHWLYLVLALMHAGSVVATLRLPRRL